MTTSTIKKQSDVRVIHLLSHVQDKGPTYNPRYQEYVNQYKDIDHVMERFAYWKEKPTTVAVQIITQISTAEVVAEWRRDDFEEITGRVGGDPVYGSQPAYGSGELRDQGVDNGNGSGPEQVSEPQVGLQTDNKVRG